MSDDYDDFKYYLSIQSDKVKKNVTEVKAADLQFPFMLHIDSIRPPFFYPQMPRRAASSEDNTIARVTVADTLVGCLIGYASTFHDMMSTAKPGYYISRIDFDYCIKPNSKLVYDAEKSNEHWLIGYNKKSLKYPTKQIGKLFISKMTIIKAYLDKEKYYYPKIESMEILIETDEAFLLNKDTVLEPGFYSFVTNGVNFNNDALFNDDSFFKCRKISEGEYRIAKNEKAALLSHTDILEKW